MAGENYTNTATTATTTVPVGPSDPSTTLTSFSGWPAAPFWGEFEKDTPSAEIVRVTNVAGSVITMTRGQGGTSATTHGAGVTFNLIAPADFFNRAEQHMAASTGVHGVSGSVVGTTGNQTVQDKTFRGAHVSQHSDANPPGVTASYLSTADNTSARDGFVHNNTAGSAARAAFKLTQSGTDRFTVSNTGNVAINPSTGTALTVTGNETVSGTLTATGVVNANGGVSTSGLTVTTSGIVVAGGAIVSGNAQFNNNVSATGTLHSNGSIDTDTNLTVDGTSTLTGAVTTGGAATVGTGLTVTQRATAWGSPVILSVASPAAVTTPVDGDVIWDRTAKLWKERVSGSWATIDRPNVHVRQTISQNIAHNTFTSLTFTNEDFDNVNGHSSITNTSRYVCQTGFAGKYLLNGGTAFDANSSGSRTCRWAVNGVAVNASQASGVLGSASSAVNAKCVIVHLAEGDYVELQAFQSSGVTLATETASNLQSSMSIAWMGA
jgi:hypothetical protein